MDDSPVQHRAKRQKIDKVGRFAALQKLKDLKGKKNKLEVQDDVDNVYDIVDENEFARAQEKFGNDWIEDDGTGYAEDGRDFFEDDGDYSDDGGAQKTKGRDTKKRGRDSEKQKTGKGSIRKLFSNAVPKKKDITVNLKDDDVLADILGDLDTNNPTASTSGISAKNDSIKEKSDATIAKEYMQNFMNNLKKKDVSKKIKTESSDDEMIDRILKPKNKKVRNDKLKKVDHIESQPQSSEIKSVSSQNGIRETPKDSKSSDDTSNIKENVEDNNDIYKDMDYSILEDDANQFEEDINIKEEEPEVGISIQQTEEEKKEKEAENYQHLLNNWENICNMDNFEEEMTTSATTDNQDINQENLKIWYWDAWEDQYKRPGEIFLFGKINGTKKDEYKSVCVHIENVDRILYLLPREYIMDTSTKQPTSQKVTFVDVYKEFNETVANDLGLTTFRSRKVTKNFAFNVPGVDVPESCEYMEVRYDGKKPAPNNKKTYKTFAHIFGTNTPALETFLLECKIKGPCWLNIKNFKINERPLSWCKLEAICPSQNCISVADGQNNQPLPIILLTMNVRTALNPKTLKNEVVMISCLVNNKFCVDKPPPNPPFNRHFCGFTRPLAQNWPLNISQKISQYKSTKVTKLDTERALLSWFLATYQSIDPDMVITHDANDCQLDVICERIADIKIPMWSRLGRLRMSNIAGKKYKDFFIGRMICDVKQSAEELIKSRSYDLDTLCINVLKIKEGDRVDVSNDDLYSLFESSEGILKLITLTMQDCSYILRLMCELNVLPLALQITNICGNLMSRTLQGGRSERNEYLLLHAFNEKNYIVPDKKVRESQWDNTDGSAQITQAGAGRKKAAYSGGLVLEPVKGFYDKFILLMDFNSLYPSIIQEYNICFTTVGEPEAEDSMPILPESSVEQGVLPRQIRRLVESRREVKKLMATPDLEADQRMQYNIRQLALKLTANSMYGCLGFSHSRFFAQHLAALVTHKGREILMNTKSLVQKLNYDVIYGDTDSIMVNTNCIDFDQVFKIGYSIKQTVNKIYRQIELDIDGVFKYLLLLKKKKYAAVTISKSKKGEINLNQEHKGLDIVRRDWSQVSVMAGKLILDEILSENQLDEKIDNIHGHLEKFKENILEGSVPLPLLAITKQLTKAPKEYTAINALAHVQVALRMNSTRNKRYKKGDMVSYIICLDGTDNPAMQRAYHLDELKSMENLKVDTTYYLAHQIHPVVSRLCEPLEGTDTSRIAGCLGLDPSKFKTAAQKVHRERMEEGVGESISKSVVQKYRLCEKFKFACISCKTENVVASAFKRVDKDYIGVLQKCANNECTFPPYQYVISIRNQLILAMRTCIRRFYENWLVCDDPACNSNTRIYPHVLTNNRPVCLACKQGILIRQYSERDLFMQLSYYQYMFDLSKHENRSGNLPLDVEAAYNALKEIVDQTLENSGYCTVNLSMIFARLNPVELKDQKVRYEGKKRAPSNKKIYQTIVHIFGTNTSALETFLLECKIKGPCWLNINNFEISKRSLSWCKFEVLCLSERSITVAEDQINPPLPVTVFAINVRTALNLNTLKNEVFMISCLVNNKFCVDKPPPNPPFNRHFCGFTRPLTQNWPLDIDKKISQYKSTKVTKLDTERALLSWFLATFQSIDPDIIITHDAHDCQLDVICDRIRDNRIPMWSRSGRLRMSNIAGKKYKDFFIGRMICDVKQSAEELIKSVSYDLHTLCVNILKIKEEDCINVSTDYVYSLYQTSEGIFKLITLTMHDCSYILRIMCELNVLALALQITNICGSLMSRTLQIKRSDRTEFLLLHAFYEKNYIVPDKYQWDNVQITHNGSGRKKAAYSGGLVLEPIKGFYDKFVLLMDFNSLYPSIIQEFNICFTTVCKPKNLNMADLPDSNVQQGILPGAISYLVKRRRQVQDLLANPDLDADLRSQYNTSQLALKLTANLIYGCLGFVHSRFFAPHLAALITYKGREILTNTKNLVQSLNFDVIYGDTDSIMVNTNCTDYDEACKIGCNINQLINKNYRQIELDIDGVFKYLLLLKKKKYAAVRIFQTKTGETNLNQEHKGLDIVRRDWSHISVIAGKLILDEIFSDKKSDEKIDNIHEYLNKFKENILASSVPLPILAITKKLNKAPIDYPAINTVPHVQVALRMNLTKQKRYKKGDTVSYIICKDGTANPATQRAYHIDELKVMDNLKVDTKYYLEHQIHPVTSRLCEPLTGTDASRIASCLGFSPTNYKIAAQKAYRARVEDGTKPLIMKPIVQKYRLCEKFKFTCISCKTENIVASAFKRVNESYIGVLEKCSNNECTIVPPYQYVSLIGNQLTLAMRAYIRRFYENWLVCDEPSCERKTRILQHVVIDNQPVCSVCKQGSLRRQYLERDLFTQLSYYQYVFDLSKHKKKSRNLPADLEAAYNDLKDIVQRVLENSAYCTLSFSKIFTRLNPAVRVAEIVVY